ncbi:hypothetical protein [Rubritalea marina]|uniref:hypothetical protein n=1 Tax=Rubritalea marina TaxID=361055 RepID=UPI000371C42C|nr:hypothetical protein [Rubritalea marina]
MDLTPPDQLNFISRYKQAKLLAKNTSRRTNPFWYSDALAVNIQLHIFVGSDTGAISYIRNVETNEWAKGPNISPEMEEDTSLLIPVLEGIRTEYFTESKRPGLGVVLYIADEFSTCELGPEHQNPRAIDELRKLIKENPASILEDQTVSNESHAWRLFPYPGANSDQNFATAIAFTRRHEALMKQFRGWGNDNNIPIRTRAISAPLCAIAALPWLLKEKPDNGFITVYHYPRFTVLGFFNNNGDLVLIRTLQHHSGLPFSPQTASAIMSAAASMEITSPNVYIIPMAGATPMGMSDSLSSMLQGSEVSTLSPTSSALHIPTAPSAANKQSDLGVTRPWKWSDLTAQTELTSDPLNSNGNADDTAIPGVTRPWKLSDMEAVAMLSQVRLEVISTTTPPSSSGSELANNYTFSTLVEEMWPLQDFLPPSEDEQAPIPQQLEMKLLLWSKYIKIAAAVIIAMTLISSSISIFKATQDPAWNYQSTNPNFLLTSLKKDIQKYHYLDNKLSDRARAWSTMELITRLFPDVNSIKIDSVNFTTSIDTNSAINNIQPIKRQWTITGSASSAAREYLDKLNSTAGISKVFQHTFEGTHDPSFDIESYRSRTPRSDIRIKLSRNARKLKNVQGAHLYEFTMTVYQTISDEDPLALISK